MPMILRGTNQVKLASAGLILAFLAGCQGGEATPTPTSRAVFLPPTADQAALPRDDGENSPTPTIIQDCENQLKFIDDLTVPDGSEVNPGQAVIKRWLVENQGSCNWDQGYSMQLISGLALGANQVQQLVPARRSSEAVIELTFTAPDNPGRYNSWWQAFDPSGSRFGDPFYVEISVVEPAPETE